MLEVFDPSPSCPWVLSPQQYVTWSTPTAQAWSDAALVVFFALPLTSGILRTLVAAFGTPAVIRLKFTTVAIEGTGIPIGIDTLYSFYTKYFMRLGNQPIARKEREDLFKVYRQYSAPDAYGQTIDMISEGLSPPDAEKRRMEKLHAANRYGQDAKGLCFAYYLLMVRQGEDPDSILEQLKFHSGQHGVDKSS
jgi:hypothetical protein